MFALVSIFSTEDPEERPAEWRVGLGLELSLGSSISSSLASVASLCFLAPGVSLSLLLPVRELSTSSLPLFPLEEPEIPEAAEATPEAAVEERLERVLMIEREMREEVGKE